jgi:hypothetical protein
VTEKLNQGQGPSAAGVGRSSAAKDNTRGSPAGISKVPGERREEDRKGVEGFISSRAFLRAFA